MAGGQCRNMVNHIIRVIASILFFSSLLSCTGLFSNLRGNQPPHLNNEVHPTPYIFPSADVLSDAIEKSISDLFPKIIKSNNSPMLVIVVLLFLWLAIKLRRAQMKSGPKKLAQGEIALIKIAKDNLDWFWENCLKSKKIVRMDNWRKGN